jgi:hypothetical protein
MSADAPEKRLATAKARAAMAGVELHAIEDDGGRPLFVCVKWALTASFTSLIEVEAWLSKVEGKR